MTAKHGSGVDPRKRARRLLPPGDGRAEGWGELAGRAASALGRSLSTAERASLGAWFERLDEWNAHIGLTAARSPEELVDLMLADALLLAPRLPHGAQVVDVGSGSGAPGLALALLRDDLRLTLVEPLGKRTSFLCAVVGAIGRTDVVLERKRGESLADRRAWDAAVSRATFPPAAWLALGATLVKPGGRVAVLLAREAPPPFAAGAVDSDETYVWPLTGARRRAVVYRVTP